MSTTETRPQESSAWFVDTTITGDGNSYGFTLQ
jgi:hypothetical protein